MPAVGGFSKGERKRGEPAALRATLSAMVRLQGRTSCGHEAKARSLDQAELLWLPFLVARSGGGNVAPATGLL